MIENQLKMISNSMIFENMTKKTLEIAAKMYFYLNSCSDEIKSWLIFYNDLFKNHQADQIVLSLNRILRGGYTRNNKFQSIAEKLFNKTTDLFTLKHQLMKNITYGLRTVNSSKEYTNVEGNNGRKMIILIVIHFNFIVVFESVNHPVHILTKDKKISVSAFIPFCDFGGNMSSMGVKIDLFGIPVCNSFQAKVLNDQLCYEVDPNKFKVRSKQKTFDKGIEFFVDQNYDRQYPTNSEETDFMIYLDTLGMFPKNIVIISSFTFIL